MTIEADESVDIDAQIEAAPAPPKQEAGLSTAAVLSFGIGAAALGAGTFFGLSANQVEEDLAGQLKRGETPNTELIAHGEDQSLYANIFFAAGTAAVGTGLLLYFLQGEPDETSASTDVVISSEGAMIRIQTPF